MPEPLQRGLLPRWRWGEPLAAPRDLLARGGILVIPTESSYALGVDPRNPHGVEAVYEVKARERGKPLPVVVADVEQAVALGIDRDLPQLRQLARWWPAPLTAVLPLTRPVAAAAGGTTLAVRVPAHERLRELLRALGYGLTATSANRSGERPVADPVELEPLLAGRHALVVDDGVLPGGPPSTIVTFDPLTPDSVRMKTAPPGTLRVLRAGAWQIDDEERT